MTRKGWPPNEPVYVVRWHRRGGAPAHRFYFRPWYAERFARTLMDAGFDVQVFRTTTSWVQLALAPPTEGRVMARQHHERNPIPAVTTSSGGTTP
jgi:hypothetical protein